MCGIAGMVYNDRRAVVNESAIYAMNGRIAHRGPDDEGIYAAPGIGLGSRRLSILDLSARGHMPMSDAEGRYWIVYNGEVYNHRELRKDLEARGHRFRSNSDTETILHLYIDKGPEMLRELNGMFAVAIWDSRERTLFLARDRLGIKPLYYAVLRDSLVFASEEKALFAAGVQPRFDPDAWEELLMFRYVAGERTPFVGVHRLLPGSYLLWKNGQYGVTRWWSLANRAAALREDLPVSPERWFRETFDDAVKLRRISDVPIGVLLSGGLDSSTVAASLATQAGEGVESFTVRFAEAGYDEGPLAEAVANKWGLRRHELSVKSSELLGLLEQACWLNDEPSAHASDLHMLAISRFAKPRVTVLLSGEGADELMGGYVRYRPLEYAALMAMARPVLPAMTRVFGMNGRVRKLARFAELDSLERFVVYNSCELLPADLMALGMKPKLRFDFREQVFEEGKKLYPDDLLRQVMFGDQHSFLCSILDRNDRMTMGASIECRVPFLDYRIVEALAAMPSAALFPGRQPKSLLRRALGRRLPSAVLRGRKWGFAVPWKAYLREVPELRETVSALPDAEPVIGGPLDRKQVRSMAAAFLAGDGRHEPLIRQLTMMAVWHRVCIREAAKTLTAGRYQ